MKVHCKHCKQKISEYRYQYIRNIKGKYPLRFTHELYQFIKENWWQKCAKNTKFNPKKGLSLCFQKLLCLHRIKIATFITTLMSFYKIHLNWQFNNNTEGRCVHLTYILTFLVNWPLSLMFVALWLNMKFSVYCRQGIKMNTLAVAIGYIILMAPITDEIWLRTLP